MKPELYYAMINIVDYLALYEVSKENQSELYEVLDKLLKIDSEDNGETTQKNFGGSADGNDVGGVKTWQQMVKEFRKLWKNGDRVIFKGEE